jgi:hypothetical protein
MMFDEKYVAQLHDYLDKLIKLQGQGHNVARELNLVLNRINYSLGLGSEMSLYEYVNRLREFENVSVYDIKASGYIEGRWMDGCNHIDCDCGCDCAGGPFKVDGNSIVLVVKK